MNRIFIILIFLLWTTNILVANNQTDYEKLDSLVTLIKENWWDNPDESLRIINSAESLAKNKMPEHLAEIVKYRGVVHYYKTEYSLAEKFYKQALAA
jgi:hypothetical protein